MTAPEVVHQVAMAIAREPRVDLSYRPIRVALDHGDLLLEGEVRDMAGKKLALERTASIPGVDRIIDRLHVASAAQVPDELLAERIRTELRSEPGLRRFRILSQPLESDAEPHLADDERGYISVQVTEGVVTLDGTVLGLQEKRLAGALTWWVPGVRDVVNGLGVEPPEPDSEEALAGTMRRVLDKDPLVDASRIQVHAQGTVVQLSGVVDTEEESRAAERDAWCLFGVDRVENRLRVVSG